MSEPASDSAQQGSGIIPAWGRKRIWFSAGVILGGAGLAATLTPEIGAGRAITAGLISAATFLVAFDRVGDFKVVRAIPAILFAVIGANVLKIPVVGGIAGFIGFMILGWLAVGVGAVVSAITGLPGSPAPHDLSEPQRKAEDSSTDVKKCPQCAENVTIEARVCRYCEHQFNEAEIHKIEESVQEERSLQKAKEALEDMRRYYRKMNGWRQLYLLLGYIFVVTAAVCFISAIVAFFEGVNPLGATVFLIVFSSFVSSPGIVFLRKAARVKAGLGLLACQIDELKNESGVALQV